MLAVLPASPMRIPSPLILDVNSSLYSEAVTAAPLKLIAGAEETAQSVNSMEKRLPAVRLPTLPNVLLLTVPKFTVPVVLAAPATLLTEQEAAEITPVKLIVPSLANELPDMPSSIAPAVIIVELFFIFTPRYE